MSDGVVIVGAGGFAREVAQLLNDLAADGLGSRPIGCLSDDAYQQGTTVGDLTVLGGVDWLAGRSTQDVVVAVGAPAVRRHMFSRVREYGHRLPTFVHPRALVGARVSFGEGCVVCAGSILTTDIALGQGVIVNLSCTIGHDARIEDWVTVSPGANISGNVHVGAGCDLGTASSYVQGVSVGEWSVVGAGAVVAKDLPPNVTAVGAPAKAIKERPVGWHLA